MSKITGHRGSTELVQKYIGTAYDDVRKVAEQIDGVKTLANIVGSGTDFAVMSEVITLLGDSVTDLAALASADLAAISNDLTKGNYLGNRKIDIDLALNNNSDTVEVTYSGVTITTNTGYNLAIDFTANGTDVEELSSYTSIYNRITDGIDEYNSNQSDPQQHIINTEIDIINSTLSNVTTLLRFRDTDGSASNVDRVVLHTYTGDFVEANPAYFWANTTSALQTLANRVGDVIALGNDIDSIIALASQTDEIGYLYSNREKLTGTINSIHSNLDKINELYINITSLVNLSLYTDEIDLIHSKREELVGDTLSLYTELTKLTDVYTNIAHVVATSNSINDVQVVSSNIQDVIDLSANIEVVKTASTAASETIQNAAQVLANKLIVEDQTQLAIQAAELASNKNAEIKGISVGTTSTLTPDSNAVVTYNSNENEFNFAIPKGDKGDRGDAFQVNALGLDSSKSLYDNQINGFSFLSTDTSLIYFKLSDASGDWSTGAPFGKGEKGDTGDTGNGLVGISFSGTTSTNSLPNQPGGVDTYTLTFTNGSTTSFTVHNGIDANINDTVVNTSETWSSDKIQDELNDKSSSTHTHSKADIGLGNVDNTSDLDKPISTAVQTALDNVGTSTATLMKLGAI